MTMRQPIDNHYDLAIIGGGASGMAAALQARLRAAELGHTAFSIALFERNDRLGKKLLTTGNGRCNLTNLDTSAVRFHGTAPEFARTALDDFPPATVIGFFESIGVPCILEDEQKVFPASLHATSVLDALRLALDENGIVIVNNCKVAALDKTGRKFSIASDTPGTHPTASAVIVATGGKCAPATGSDGGGYRLLTAFSHELIQPLPSIVQLTTETAFVKPLSGNKIRGSATLVVDAKPVRTECGEILFTDYGLSGPPILQLSGEVSRVLNTAQVDKKTRDIEIRIDFLPAQPPCDTTKFLLERRQRFGMRSLEEFLTGLFHRRLAYGLLKQAVQKTLSSRADDLNDNEIERLAGVCRALPVKVTGTMSFSHAQTTAGGIDVAGFDARTMGSRKTPGLFACGEVLDIDGDCGGFNLQWAWASGFLAGRSAIEFLHGGTH